MRRILAGLFGRPATLVGLAIILTVVLAALLAPWLAPYAPAD